MTVKNLSQIVQNIDGTDLMHEGKPLTFKRIITDALMMNFSDEKATGDEKFKRFMLTLKISEEGDTDLTPEEMVMIKNSIGKDFKPIIVGRVFTLLDK